ncbi:AbrB family transcriptional regulator [Corynebacterium epidermidicanis]|uniref:AbrB family transcriptional regulator n=1 Tax=Corynebacterium epidermidicanis TaxID=1050174 RepID=UPI00191BE14D|nr:AbrB family transcriptional regulator [Corynebacterium epidermidicanis]
MRSTSVIRWLVVVPVTAILGALFSWLHVPAAWILAAIVASAGCAIYTEEELHVHPLVGNVARSMIAILAAAPIIAADPHQLLHFIVPGLIVAALTIGIGLAGGLILARSSAEISPETGITSMLPGGASLMPVIAQEVGADFRYVTLTQYLRVLCVAISLPLLVPLMDVPSGGVEHPAVFHSWQGYLTLIAIIIVGEPLGKLLRIPSPSILGPMILTILAAQFFSHPSALALPPEAKLVAFASIGWAAGGALSTTALKMFTKRLPATFVFIGVLMSSCALFAVPLHLWLGTSYFEAYLGTTPGGLETVLALADEFGAGPSVAALQVIRLISIVLVASYLPSIVRLLTRRR